ncbi:hypothetical protein ACFQX6_46130 [Streptosporangium lutulentum]
MFGFITDEVLSRQSLEAFWVPALAWLGLAVVAGLASFVGAYATAVGGSAFCWGCGTTCSPTSRRSPPTSSTTAVWAT